MIAMRETVETTLVDEPMQTTTMQSAPIVIRPMTMVDLAAATELSQEQQWPHRIEDWTLFLKQGEGITATRDGKVVGTILGWRFGDDMARIGMVIVAPALQKQGIGHRLTAEMLDRLGNRTVILNATDVGHDLYKELGFVETHIIRQYHGICRDVPLAELKRGDRVRPKGQADTGLADLYSAADGMDRRSLFMALASESRTVVYSRDDEAVGFAMIRRFGHGWLIGPVVAPDVSIAKALILHWLAVKQGSFCRIDVTEESGLGPWVESLGLTFAGSVRTMARGPAPQPGGPARVFALAAQALG